MNRKVYALFLKDELVGCYFTKSKAAHRVDEHLGTSMFSPRWIEDTKGDYEIVECETYYNKIYVISKARIFASMEELLELLKENDVKVIKKMVKPTYFRIQTERGLIKGKVVTVK